MENLRPMTLSDIEGQDTAKQMLTVVIEAHRRTNQCASHMLFLGPAGVGKTTLALVTANELGVRLHNVMASRISNWNDLLTYIEALREGDILFIDEIHALHPKIQLELYGIMEDFTYDGLTRDWRGKIVRGKKEVPRFTLIGATTDTGELAVPLMSRFKVKIYLEQYTLTQLSAMIQKAAKRMYKLEGIPKEVTDKLASLSQRNARNAYSLLDNLMKVAWAEFGRKVRGEQITPSLVEQSLRIQAIDPIIGLDRVSRKYLYTLLSENTALGLNTLVALVNEQPETIKSMIEPFLVTDIDLPVNGHTLQGAFVKMTRRGRVATKLASEYLRICEELQKQGWFGGEKLKVSTEDYIIVS